MEKSSNRKGLSSAETASFCSQMGMILRSGISSMEGLMIMKEDAASDDEKVILDTIYNTLMETGSFHEALVSAGVFPAYMLQMVSIGEQSGRLDEVMNSLASYYEREDSIASAIRSAVTYPMIMTVMMLLVILLLITRVLPVFNQVFAQFGTEMTGVSRALMNLGSVINRYAVVFIVILLVIAVGFVFFTKSKSGRAFILNLTGRIRLTRALQEKTAACRFAGGMALTLASGLTTEESLTMAGALSDSPVFQARLEDCRKRTEEGESLSEALASSGIFSGLYARMVTVGYKTGALDEVMQKIASQYQEEIDERLSSTISVLEPTLVAVLSVVTGLILLSVMLPLMGILAGI